MYILRYSVSGVVIQIRIGDWRQGIIPLPPTRNNDREPEPLGQGHPGKLSFGQWARRTRSVEL